MESQVVCEVCGKNIIDHTDQETMNFCHSLDLFACPRCITSWAIMQKHLDLKIIECQTQSDIDNISRIKCYLENRALTNLLKSNPMPVPEIEAELPKRNRMEDIIMGDEEDGNRE